MVFFDYSRPSVAINKPKNALSAEVAAVVALTGKQYSAKLALNTELLSQVRERFQSVEDNFKAATGYGFDALTESEARYLAKHDNAQSIRDRIIAAGGAASLRENAGDARKNVSGLGLFVAAYFECVAIGHSND